MSKAFKILTKFISVMGWILIIGWVIFCLTKSYHLGISIGIIGIIFSVIVIIHPKILLKPGLVFKGEDYEKLYLKSLRTFGLMVLVISLFIIEDKAILNMINMGIFLMLFLWLFFMSRSIWDIIWFICHKIKGHLKDRGRRRLFIFDIEITQLFLLLFILLAIVLTRMLSRSVDPFDIMSYIINIVGYTALLLGYIATLLLYSASLYRKIASAQPSNETKTSDR
ncbi:hypothetical protein ES703_121828 [subsurface metagenome]